MFFNIYNFLHQQTDTENIKYVSQINAVQQQNVFNYSKFIEFI